MLWGLYIGTQYNYHGVYAMPYINACAKQIYFEEYGTENNPVLLYLHGGPGESCLTYTYQAKQLGSHFHVISFDQYGVNVNHLS